MTTHAILGALALTGAMAYGAAAQQPPWRPGDDAPPAGQLRLGESLAELDSALGAPSRVSFPRPGREARQYSDRGVSLIADSAGGVVWIALLTRRAGDIAGVRVGDSKEFAEQRLGAPSHGRAETKKYSGGGWNILVQLDPTVEFVYTLALATPEFYPASDFGFLATLKGVVADLYDAGEAFGILWFVSLTDFLLWRKYRFWVPRYVHLLALVSFLLICWLNWLWIQAGGVLTVRRVIIILFFPAIVYFFFVGYGGVKAALGGRRVARPDASPWDSRCLTRFATEVAVSGNLLEAP